jgi:hypothetical protein
VLPIIVLLASVELHRDKLKMQRKFLILAGLRSQYYVPFASRN